MYLLEILTSVILFPPQDDYFNLLMDQLRITGLGLHTPKCVIPTEKPIDFDEESTVCTSQSSGPESPTVDPHVIRLRSFLRMTVLGIAIP